MVDATVKDGVVANLLAAVDVRLLSPFTTFLTELKSNFNDVD